MFSPLFRDPLMSFDPFHTHTGVMDPFTVFENDPFFNPVRRAQRTGGQGQQQQLTTGGTEDMNKDQTALSTGQQQPSSSTALTTGAPSGDVGFWNFDRFLSEPLSLGLEDKQDRYVMNVVKPAHIGDHDLKIDINNDVLTVHGDVKQEHEDKDKDGKRRSYSYSSSSFSRSIRLPPNVDQSKISANMVEPGKLVIDLPKRPEEQKKSREIAIKGQQSTGGKTSGGNTSGSSRV